MTDLPTPASPAARSLARALGLSVTAGDVLHRRGIGEAEARRFLAPKLAELTPPDAMLGRREVAQRLALAVRRRERVVVFGDYDCDGITATAILTDALRRLGGHATPLLANRFAGGYGLSDAALARALAERPAVLVTCDCGSADGPRVEAARAAGVDVIVIDHHLVPDRPLPALAFLNPHRPGCGFAYKGLASCGLAMSVAAAVRLELGAQLDVKGYLDLVAIGTIADVAPLDGDNRALVRAGLEALRAGSRPGLLALGEYARLDRSGPLTAQDVSFGLAPRLNAPGRLGSPEGALNLLLASDLVEARKAAAVCEQANQERQALQARMVDEATAEAMRPDMLEREGLVFARKGWHHGIVGVVAGRLTSQLRRPVVVAGVDETGVATGSVRSFGGVPVVTALERCRSLLLGFGGHQKAAGLTFRVEHLDALGDAFARACAELGGGPGSAPRAFADVLVDPSDDLRAVVTDMQRFEPCGEANPAPVLCVANARVKSAREMKGGHLRVDLERGGEVLGAFAFGLGHLAPKLRGQVHAAGSLRRDAYKGGDAIELRLEAIEPA